ncbi:S8 family serine peptidase [Methylobacterium planeticum]|uniref:S8 family serine peptidase n=1 Tax=Methylobacterium planeticum TaxID=2615211 RepID=A0A6N6MED1_9HYPH|nr:S8 family serine peptidase [Methylobacterium planeticum]KAB1068596.1 S8 family serine peptidase [Methylobacterium planeticum]
MAKVGPLLRSVIDRLDKASPALRNRELSLIASHIGGSEHDANLPLVMQFRRTKPARGETWEEFKDRVARDLEPRNDALSGGKAQPLFLANALAASIDSERVKRLAELDAIDKIELDPVVYPIAMDDAVVDLQLDAFRNRHGQLTGRGVRIAVLDSGVDEKHPHLRVEASVSTCGEDVAIPGRHGTHCAGSIASRDTIFPGIAPDVSLLNVKVLKSDGSGQNTNISKGVDEALNLKADIASMSLGFNHLPSWSDGGHGWSCPDGRCPLCTSVDNAVLFGLLVCAAAGNEHSRADALRRFGHGGSFDTELGCPGQARGAITVGAITKRTFLAADFSSRGPSSFGQSKPDLCGPGVNVMSTVPVPRQADGKLATDPQRVDLFGRSSGTSMATPIVAGALALIFQERREKGLSVAPAAMRKALLDQAAAPMMLPDNVVGRGRIDLGRMGVDPETS